MCKMKLDGETVLFHGTVDHKSDQKPVGENNGAIDSDGLRSEHRLESKEQSGAFYDLKSGEGKTDRLQYAFSEEHCWAIPKLDCSMRANDLINDDKSVMEPELPELVVCYKENNYHIVKDICIDDGVPSNDKFLFDTDVDEQKLCTFLISGEKNSELEQVKSDLDMHIPDLLESSTEENLAIGGSRNEFRVEHNLKELTPVRKIDQDAMEEDVNGASKEFFSLGELLSMSKMGGDLSQPKSSHDSMDNVEQLSQRPHENTILTWSRDPENVNEQASLVSPTTVSTSKESGIHFGCEEASLQIHDPDSAVKAPDPGHDGTCIPSPPDSAAEESENGSKEKTLESHNIELNRTVGDKCENSKLETGSITFDSNSCAPAASQGDTGTEAFSSQLQRCQGESSFSAAGGPISGLISYSGPIAYSGSLSIRSDSSTTSTRSFAFPILNSEWNSSPVRMAKADRRCIRKQRSWRETILCCRF
ncbi:uncharacterized protein [Euphorbia lathyris]|uniref:uncharacterized protein isoform X2 n=1 Tax=Euphorbia lathyris TaxID=212925 RepID=UPI0033131180